MRNDKVQNEGFEELVSGQMGDVIFIYLFIFCAWYGLTAGISENHLSTSKSLVAALFSKLYSSE